MYVDIFTIVFYLPYYCNIRYVVLSFDDIKTLIIIIIIIIFNINIIIIIIIIIIRGKPSLGAPVWHHYSTPCLNIPLSCLATHLESVRGCIAHLAN